jgi:hypothetical protein
MKTITNDLVITIAGFYAAMYGERIGNRDYTSEMLSVFDQLHQRAFPGYQFAPTEFLAQAKTQLFGNELAVRNYYSISFRFAPLSGEGESLVIHMGATSTPKTLNGTLGIWTEDPAINDAIQGVLKEVAPEDAEDQAEGGRGLWARVKQSVLEMVSRRVDTIS